MKGIIYYTDNRLAEPLFSIVQKQILKAKLPIVSVSLRPLNFGKNIVLNKAPSFLTMLKQITKALEKSTANVVFFCEHDVLYPTSHFDFTPPRGDLFYYNAHVWRWDYPTDKLITYDRLISLSGLCVDRHFALDHYKRRLQKITELNLDKSTSHEPLWARKWGYEPGTKKIKRGGFSDDDFETWRSKEPLIDIRHKGTFSPPKITLDSFKHRPANWQETTIEKIPGWNLKELFKI